ncbi:hypothetical protein C8J57DRAFT_1458465 [Mycena rebaudengoi]|nr:hypothetical protein C8J57DRAFT_1458465 [Mycena rebaudengoi]
MAGQRRPPSQRTAAKPAKAKAKENTTASTETRVKRKAGTEHAPLAEPSRKSRKQTHPEEQNPTVTGPSFHDPFAEQRLRHKSTLDPPASGSLPLGLHVDAQGFDPGMTVAQAMEWRPNEERPQVGRGAEFEVMEDEEEETIPIDPLLSTPLLEKQLTHPPIPISSSAITPQPSSFLSSLASSSSSVPPSQPFSFASFSSVKSKKLKATLTPTPSLALSGTNQPNKPPNTTPFTFALPDPRSLLTSFTQARDIQPPIPPAPILSSDPFAPVPTPSTSRSTIPKAFTDKVTALDSQSATLVDQMALNTRTLKIVQEDYADLRERIDELENANQNLQFERDDLTAKVDNMTDIVDELRETVTAQQTALEKFGVIFEDLGGSEEVTAALATKHGKSAQEAVKVARNNNLNSGIRKTIYRALGVPQKNQKYSTAYETPTAGGCWIDDPETEGGKLLRPDFKVGYAKNSGWQDDAVKFVKTHLHSEQPNITEDTAKNLSDAAVREQIQTVFKGIKAKYTKWKKSGATTGSATNQPNEPSAVKNRRTRRKERKLAERKAVRPEELGIDWDFFFQVAYQSTDESDQTSVLDPDSGSEHNVVVAAVQKPWITRVPMYRNAAFDDGVQQIDVLVFKERKKREQSGQNLPRARRRGAPKDVELPRLSYKKLKIPRAAISTEWLAEHKDQDTPTRIHSEDVAGTAADVEDNEDEDDEEE